MAQSVEWIPLSSWAKQFYNAYGDSPVVIINRILEVIESLKEFPGDW